MFTDAINGFSPGMLRAGMIMAGYEGLPNDLVRIIGYSHATACKRMYKGLDWSREEMMKVISACRLSPAQIVGIWFNLPEEIQKDIDENNDVIVFRPPKNPEAVPVPGSFPEGRIGSGWHGDEKEDFDRAEKIIEENDQYTKDNNVQSRYGTWKDGTREEK